MLTDGQKLILPECKGYNRRAGTLWVCRVRGNPTTVPCLSGVVKFCTLTRRPSALRAERLKRYEMTGAMLWGNGNVLQTLGTYSAHCVFEASASTRKERAL